MYIGIDLGGTKIAAGLADAQGKLQHKLSVKTISGVKGQSVVDQIIDLINALSKKTSKKIKAVGIGIPGFVDDQGKLVNVPNIPALQGINLLKELTKRKKLKYVLENDANAAALAELIYGAGRNLKNFVYVTISTGIGGGIVIDGKLYRGSHGTAGEVGHMVVFPGGPDCGCGNKGCWESVGSGTALANMARARLGTGIRSKIAELVQNDLSKIKGEVIETAAKQNDPLALELLDVNGYYNALGIANLINIFDPEAVIIGGGLSFSGKYFFGPLFKCLQIFTIFAPRQKVKILKAGCRKDAGLLGALALVTQ